MAICAVRGGCPTDYVALGIATLSFILLLIRSSLPFLIKKAPHTKRSGFWLPVIQVFASFNFLISIALSANFLKFQRGHWLLSCYIWAVWFEGPLGFGLLMSCRIAQAFQLYYIFVKRRLPPLKSHVFLPLLLLLWIAVAALIQVRKTLSSRCHMGMQSVIPVVCLHLLYVSGLVAFTAVIRHVEFKFDELKDLLRGIFVAALLIGTWIFAYILYEVHDEISWVQVASRFSLLFIASVLVLVFFSLSSSQPLLSQISLRRNEPLRFETMGQALGIPDSGLLLHREPAVAIDPNEPLDKLLLNKKFRQSFMAFADSCLAGESVHFFEEVHELGKIPSDDPVRRIYMARHIIDKYVIAGAAMEVNISHKSRQEILTTNDLADCGLFDKALNEVTQLMKMNLAKDYWSSIYFMKFKEASARPDNRGLAEWDLPPRLSVVQAPDDPFSQDHFSKGSSNSSPGMNP